MGFVRKVVGSLTGANQAAKATENAARVQADATRAAAEQSAQAARDAAAQAAQQQSLTAARNAALTSAAEQTNKPLENPEVLLDAPADTSSAATARKRRATFGVGTSGGVNI